MGGEISCPCCSSRRPALSDLDALFIDLMNERGLTENAQSVLEAVYLAAGRPVTADPIFDRMYDHDANGGPSLARCYAELQGALGELTVKLDGTGVVVIRQGREGWRLGMVDGGAYLAA